MPITYVASVIDEPLQARRQRWLAIGGLALAFLLVAMSLAGLLVPATYARETEAWTAQAVAQDWFDLVVAAPALAVTAIWGARGSRRGLLAFAGTLLFTAYTAVIYAFSVHLNAMFLVYCAALGVALYALLGVWVSLWQSRAGLQIGTRIPRRTIAGFTIAIGVGFGLLWLGQLIPAAVAGAVPDELAATGLPTNPVHVLDLSFILPLHVIAGIAFWRMKTGYLLLAPIVLVFGALMSASIATLTAYAGSVPLTVVMGTVSLVSAVLATRALRTLR